jgi:DNA uptake protein ComE-like DNA-binding protein
MYCISPGKYKMLEPYIFVSEIKQSNDTLSARKSNPDSYRDKKHSVMVELNSADTLVLQQLPLVGAGRARMIFRYREKLGGFYSVEQLREVYTIDSSVYTALLPHVKVDATLLRKFNINRDSISHPYIPRKIGAILTAYRKQHGNFKDISDLQQVSLPDDQLPVKIAPYVTFE